MYKPFSVLKQFCVPQHLLSQFAGWLANSKQVWLKNKLIQYFLSRFDVNMKEAVIENPYDYPSFNGFFTRYLKPEARPIAPSPFIASPADGFICQIGKIHEGALLQAKGHSFNVTDLLGGEQTLGSLFAEGSFATIYLSPKDYHRVHMPIAGKLRKTVFIPGKLFSVNPVTTTYIPNLFARNERLVTLFETEDGPMAVILVGAMLVGSIGTIWQPNTRSKEMVVTEFDGSLALDRGAELGHFKMGSTVIILFTKNKVTWESRFHEDSTVCMGQAIGVKY